MHTIMLSITASWCVALVISSVCHGHVGLYLVVAMSIVSATTGLLVHLS
jgi:hypothetical protein